MVHGVRAIYTYSDGTVSVNPPDGDEDPVSIHYEAVDITKTARGAQRAARQEERVKRKLTKTSQKNGKPKSTAPRKKKSKSEEVEDEEEEESQRGDEDDEEDEDEEDGEDEEETGSFHTDSEDEEEEEELDDDESERLEEEGPLDDKTRQLRARMQAMMEAAESRARGDAPSPPSKKSSLKKTKSTGKPKPVEEDEDAGYDLAPLSSFGKPLSAEVLRKAEEADKARLAKKAEQDAIAKAKGQQVKRTRKKRKVEPNTRVISYVTQPSCLKSTNGTERRKHYMSYPRFSAPTSLRTHYRQFLNLE